MTIIQLFLDSVCFKRKTVDYNKLIYLSLLICFAQIAVAQTTINLPDCNNCATNNNAGGTSSIGSFPSCDALKNPIDIMTDNVATGAKFYLSKDSVLFVSRYNRDGSPNNRMSSPFTTARFHRSVNEDLGMPMAVWGPKNNDANIRFQEIVAGNHSVIMLKASNGDTWLHGVSRASAWACSNCPGFEYDLDIAGMGGTSLASLSNADVGSSIGWYKMVSPDGNPIIDGDFFASNSIDQIQHFHWVDEIGKVWFSSSLLTSGLEVTNDPSTLFTFVGNTTPTFKQVPIPNNDVIVDIEYTNYYTGFQKRLMLSATDKLYSFARGFSQTTNSTGATPVVMEEINMPSGITPLQIKATKNCFAILGDDDKIYIMGGWEPGYTDATAPTIPNTGEVPRELMAWSDFIATNGGINIREIHTSIDNNFVHIETQSGELYVFIREYTNTSVSPYTRATVNQYFKYSDLGGANFDFGGEVKRLFYDGHNSSMFLATNGLAVSGQLFSSLNGTGFNINLQITNFPNLIRVPYCWSNTNYQFNGLGETPIPHNPNTIDNGDLGN